MALDQTVAFDTILASVIPVGGVGSGQFIQSDQKVMQLIPKTCCICQKINYTEIRIQKKKMLYSVLEISTAFSSTAFFLILLFDATQ
jgi:hypothetical protein